MLCREDLSLGIGDPCLGAGVVCLGPHVTGLGRRFLGLGIGDLGLGPLGSEHESQSPQVHHLHLGLSYNDTGQVIL